MKKMLFLLVIMFPLIGATAFAQTPTDPGSATSAAYVTVRVESYLYFNTTGTDGESAADPLILTLGAATGTESGQISNDPVTGTMQWAYRSNVGDGCSINAAISGPSSIGSDNYFTLTATFSAGSGNTAQYSAPTPNEIPIFGTTAPTSADCGDVTSGYIPSGTITYTATRHGDPSFADYAFTITYTVSHN